MVPPTKPHLETQLVVYATIFAVLSAIVTVALGLRLWVRTRITHKVASDDYLLVLAHLINVMAIAFWLPTYTLQLHDPQKRNRSSVAIESRLFVGAIVSHVVSAALTKISIAAFFFKIVKIPWHKRLIIGPLVAYLVCAIVGFFLIIFRCGAPLRAQRILVADQCWLPMSILKPTAISTACLNALCDWCFTLVPIQLLYRESRTKKESRHAAIAVICIAAMGSTVSIIRVPLLTTATFGPKFFTQSGPWYCVSILETTIAILAICLASLKPLISHIRRKGREASQETTATPPAKGPRLLQTLIRPLGAGKGREAVKIDRGVIKNIGILPDSTINCTIIDVNESTEEKDGFAPKGKPGLSILPITYVSTINEVMYSTPVTDVAPWAAAQSDETLNAHFPVATVGAYR